MNHTLAAGSGLCDNKTKKQWRKKEHGQSLKVSKSWLLRPASSDTQNSQATHTTAATSEASKSRVGKSGGLPSSGHLPGFHVLKQMYIRTTQLHPWRRYTEMLWPVLRQHSQTTFPGARQGLILWTSPSKEGSRAYNIFFFLFFLSLQYLVLYNTPKSTRKGSSS